MEVGERVEKRKVNGPIYIEIEKESSLDRKKKTPMGQRISAEVVTPN